MQIINKVSGTKTISWDILRTYEFNDLKDKDRDISKLKNSIVNDGFSFPLYLWKDHKYIIDGNGRNIALHELSAEGYIIPDLPVVEIEANTKQHAKKLVLLASSQYGKVTQESYDLFIEDIDLELDDVKIELDDIDLELDEESFENKEQISKILDGVNPYSQDFKHPVYEPKGEMPEIKELFNNEKYKKL